MLKSAIHELFRLGVSLPAIHDSGEVEGFPFALYERLPGDDLENVYSSLTAKSRKEIAASVAWVQERVGTLRNSISASILCGRMRLRAFWTGQRMHLRPPTILSEGFLISPERMTTDFGGYLASVESVAFLYDLNVRNVIVRDGRMTGIIDVDEVWFGDPLLAIGRGKALLLAMQHDVEFIDYWCDHLKLSSDMTRMVDLYALLYCIRFMATSGQKLNGNYSIQTDTNNISVLKKVAEALLSSLN